MVGTRLFTHFVTHVDGRIFTALSGVERSNTLGTMSTVVLASGEDAALRLHSSVSQ